MRKLWTQLPFLRRCVVFVLEQCPRDLDVPVLEKVVNAITVLKALWLEGWCYAIHSHFASMKCYAFPLDLHLRQLHLRRRSEMQQAFLKHLMKLNNLWRLLLELECLHWTEWWHRMSQIWAVKETASSLPFRYDGQLVPLLTMSLTADMLPERLFLQYHTLHSVLTIDTFLCWLASIYRWRYYYYQAIPPLFFSTKTSAPRVSKHNNTYEYGSCRV